MNQAEKCYKCSQVPDDILMLACNHDLCLICAAKSFSTQAGQGPMKIKKLKLDNRQEFICEVCSSVTDLDSSSVYELEKIHIQLSLNNNVSLKYPSIYEQQRKQSRNDSQPKVAHEKSQQKPSKQSNENRSYSNLRNDKENQRGIFIKTNIKKGVPNRNSLSTLPTRLNKQSSDASFIIGSQNGNKSLCIDHPEEEISYFCFDCLTKCICPECIIHGVHKNHEVKTIKKSYPIVKKILEEYIEQNGGVQSQIDQQRLEIDRRQNQQHTALEALKQQVASEFQVPKTSIKFYTLDHTLDAELKGIRNTGGSFIKCPDS